MNCFICGNSTFISNPVLWDELINDWQLNAEEVAYINRQQGTCCSACNANLRSIAIAQALIQYYHFTGTLKEFFSTAFAQGLSVLEINLAGNLHDFLKKLPNHFLASYPDYDMMNLAFADSSFDVIIHSDTLEHIPNPQRAMEECRRILKPNGVCIFTVPIIVDRLNKSRSNMKKSYHGDSSLDREDYIVHTEFGADVWTLLAKSGFKKIMFSILEYPSAIAIVAFNSSNTDTRVKSSLYLKAKKALCSLLGR
jgi:SAM-dependent methyltransferase